MKFFRYLAMAASLLLLAFLIFTMIQTNFIDEEYPSGMIGNQTGPLPTESFDDGIQVGSMAPDFVLENLSGELIRLSDLRGQKVFLNFWASWCGPCKDEMPHMQEVYENRSSEDTFEIVAVNMTKRERSQQHVTEFVETYDLTFPVLFDHNGEVEKLYEVIAYPSSYVIDEQGVITHYFKGPVKSAGELTELMK